MTLALIFLACFLGSFSAIVAYNYAQEWLRNRTVATLGPAPSMPEGKVCTSCRSHVYRFHELPNGHISCANCTRERELHARR